MMAESFYLRVPDATDIDVGFGRFRQQMEGGMADVARAVDELVALDSFQGLAADSVKSYFLEVHQVLLRLLQLLVAELDTIYNSPYYEGVLTATGDGAGEFPSWDMWDKARSLDGYANDAVPPIDRLMRQAHDVAPADCPFDTPCLHGLTSGMRLEARHIDTVREGIERAEESGVSALSRSDGSFQRLYTAISEAMARCTGPASVGMAGYGSGMFRQATADLGLRELAAAAASGQASASADVLAAKRKGAENRSLDIERERQKAAEEKQWWAMGGTVLQVAILGAAVLGLCVATGGIAIAFSALAVAGASYGLVQRAGHLTALSTDPTADLGESPSGVALRGLEDADDVQDLGEHAGDVVASNRLFARIDRSGLSDVGKAHYQGGAVHNMANGVSKTAVSLGVLATGEVLDGVVGDRLEGGAHAAYDGVKTAGEYAVSKLSEHVIDKRIEVMDLPDSLARSVEGRSLMDRFTHDAVRSGTQKAIGKGAGVVAVVAECGQIYTDYQVDRLDQVIDACDEQTLGLDAYQSSLEGGQAYEWEVAW